jgi:glucan phosphoethanolaminetransferase (alkaline phosphatase superfamily)
MVKALLGIVVEQDSIMISFFLSIFFCYLSYIGYAFIIMTIEAAIVSAVIILIAMFASYFCYARIYNRFKVCDTNA